MSNVKRYHNPYGLADPFFDGFFQCERNEKSGLMETDIIKDNNKVIMKINMPEVKKENITATLRDGYLTVSYKYDINLNNDVIYIMRERNISSGHRSYYVGHEVSLDDIKAKLNDGVLTLVITKKYVKAIQNHVAIE